MGAADAGAAVGAGAGALLDRMLREKDDSFDDKRRHLRRDEVAAAFRKSDNRCEVCRSTYNLTIDHIVPLKNSGTNDSYNLQVLCRTCNSRKGAR
jgi:5-methylcytosine-specific restriction endonuclease McrA